MNSLILLCLLAVSTVSWDLAKDYSATDIGGTPTSADFTRDSSRFIVGRDDGTLQQYTVTSPYGLLNNLTLNGSVVDVKANPKQDYAAVCTANSLYIINLQSFSVQSTGTYPGGSSCKDLSWYPNGTALVVVGSASSETKYYTYSDFNNLNSTTATATEFAAKSGAYDSAISPNGNLLALAGNTYDGNSTDSNLQLYNLASGSFVSGAALPSALANVTKHVQFSPDSSSFVVYNNTVLALFATNSLGQYALSKTLTFASNIHDAQFIGTQLLAVARTNGSSTLVEEVSLADSTSNSIVINSQVSTDKLNSTFLTISDDGSYMFLGFESSGANLYTKNSNTQSFAAVIAAVVGSVVVGSVATVTAASTIAGAAGGQAAGIIGAAPTGQATTGALNGFGGVIQKNLL